MSAEKEEHPHISNERLKSLPALPGVYLMKDKSGEVIYVGKAKSLRARVRSYFSFSDTRPSVRFIVKKIVTLETLITEDERQALVLEADLIGRYQPRYNIQLKDDRSHLLVKINLDHKWPRLELVRKRKDDGAKYLGPFAFSQELKTLLEIVRSTLPLRTCSDKVIYNRVRPCLEHQIKRCAAPCCLDVDHGQYQVWLKQAIRILEGKSKDVLKSLEQDMEKASSEMRFEDAATTRDRIEILKRSWVERPSSGYGRESQDAFGLFVEDDKAEISVLKVRGGRLVEPTSYSLDCSFLEQEELLASFVSRFYEVEELPSEILLPFPIEDMEIREELYSDKSGGKVVINIPQRGSKARLTRLAAVNAEESAQVGSDAPLLQALEDLQEKLGLEQLPRTIECIDISHFQGGQTVGSVVFFKDGKPFKDNYRRFHLEHQSTPDDFASMKDVVRRHLKRGVEENTLPDLIVVDGGKGQLSSAVEARAEVSGSQPLMIGLAKRRTMTMPYRVVEAPGRKRNPVKPERIFFENEKAPLVLNPSSKALHLLERIRDEAHRFAITFHRKKRSSAQFKSSLDLVKGIGPKRRQELLREFGSVAAIREATVEDVVQRVGLSRSLAERLLAVLKA